MPAPGPTFPLPASPDVWPAVTGAIVHYYGPGTYQAADIVATLAGRTGRLLRRPQPGQRGRHDQPRRLRLSHLLRRPGRHHLVDRHGDRPVGHLGVTQLDMLGLVMSKTNCFGTIRCVPWALHGNRYVPHLCAEARVSVDAVGHGRHRSSG